MIEYIWIKRPYGRYVWHLARQTRIFQNVKRKENNLSQFQLEKRFGYIAVDNGFITEEQLTEAMMIQIKENLCGKGHRLVGKILLELGYINEEQIALVLNAMHFPFAFCSNFVGVRSTTTPKAGHSTRFGNN